MAERSPYAHPEAVRRCARVTEEIERDESYPFLLFRDRDHALLGGLTLGQVRRGVAQAVTLGYWMGAPHAGRGYMGRAVQAAVQFAFATLRLHRIEAACLPHNEPSIRLLQRAYEVVRGAGWELVNADCVLVGEEPRIAPVRDAMRARLAGAMGVDVDRITVRATTTDELGFTGRGEGLAAQAVALLGRGS